MYTDCLGGSTRPCMWSGRREHPPAGPGHVGNHNVTPSHGVGCGPGCKASEVEELQGGRRKLLRVVEAWLRAELEASRATEAADPAAKALRPGAQLPPHRAPLMPTKHMMFFRG